MKVSPVGTNWKTSENESINHMLNLYVVGKKLSKYV